MELEQMGSAHRWLPIAFTVGVIVNSMAVARGKYIVWVGLLALLPLALLPFSGLYLFARRAVWAVGVRGGLCSTPEPATA